MAKRKAAELEGRDPEGNDALPPAHVVDGFLRDFAAIEDFDKLAVQEGLAKLQDLRSKWEGAIPAA